MAEKLDMKSMDITSENIAKIKALFPSAVTEVKGEDGKVRLAIDFDALKQELSEDLISDKAERYQMTWPDKSKAKVLASSRITATLRPDKEKSVDFDTTENLYIEGDNLDVLKLLRETYLGKVKMIYIDPPYNTGNDFVYEDDFAMSADDYAEVSGQYDEQGNRLVRNLDSNGRFHTDWLNMMYARLKASRDLLSNDGVVYISIDDSEVVNLKKICDEIFGEGNFIAQIIWKNKFGSGALTSGFIGVHEYILVYSKEPIVNITRTLTDEERANYNKTRDSKFDTRGGYVTQPLAVTTFGDRPNLRYPITYKGQEIWPQKQWVWEKSRMLKAIENDEVVFNLQKDGSYNLRSKKYLIDENGNERRGKPTTIYTDVYTQNGTEDIRCLFDKILFDYTKPVQMIEYLLSLEINNLSSKDDIILDFFSGSATTAHAVMQLNAEDGGKRKFIMVQLPEKCDEKSEAYKAGYKTICDIGEERIRRAGKKIKEEKGLTAQGLDIGFRVLKLDSSNMQEVYYNPSAMTQDLLGSTVDNVKPDRTPLDLLFQVMLDLGVELSAKIEEHTVNGKTYYTVNGNDIIACFDDDIDNDVITAIAKQNPLYAVFKDKSFATDSVGINNEQLFKTYSPSTDVKVL